MAKGVYERRTFRGRPTLARRIVALLEMAGSMTQPQVAVGLGDDVNPHYLRNALRGMRARGLLIQPRHGLWSLPTREPSKASASR